MPGAANDCPLSRPESLLRPVVIDGEHAATVVMVGRPVPADLGNG